MVANTYGATIADALISKMRTAENLTNILQSRSLGADSDNQIIALGDAAKAAALALKPRLSNNAIGACWSMVICTESFSARRPCAS
jgi:hypothetical protein